MFNEHVFPYHTLVYSSSPLGFVSHGAFLSGCVDSTHQTLPFNILSTSTLLPFNPTTYRLATSFSPWPIDSLSPLHTLTFSQSFTLVTSNTSSLSGSLDLSTEPTASVHFHLLCTTMVCTLRLLIIFSSLANSWISLLPCIKLHILMLDHIRPPKL